MKLERQQPKLSGFHNLLLYFYLSRPWPCVSMELTLNENTIPLYYTLSITSLNPRWSRQFVRSV